MSKLVHIASNLLVYGELKPRLTELHPTLKSFAE